MYVKILYVTQNKIKMRLGIARHSDFEIYSAID